MDQGAVDPIPATGNTPSAADANSMDFADGKVRHMTTIWSDEHALRQLGWA